MKVMESGHISDSGNYIPRDSSNHTGSWDFLSLFLCVHKHSHEKNSVIELSEF